MIVGQQNRTHGKTGTPEFAAWMHLRKKHEAETCQEWLGSFEEFYAVVGQRPSAEYELGRIVPLGLFTATNAKWMTIPEADNRSSNRMITHSGRTQSLRKWCRELGVSYSRAHFRLTQGWEPEKILASNNFLVTHHAARTAEYRVWNNMKGRCNNPKNGNYRHYGKRGISVCDRWTNSFEAFIKDMGLRPSDKHQIDRINNDGNYEPSNCRWATSTQNTSNRRNSKLVTFAGKTQTLAAWGVELSIKYRTLRMRLELGWTIERALTTKSIR